MIILINTTPIGTQMNTTNSRPAGSSQGLYAHGHDFDVHFHIFWKSIFQIRHKNQDLDEQAGMSFYQLHVSTCVCMWFLFSFHAECYHYYCKAKQWITRTYNT